MSIIPAYLPIPRYLLMPHEGRWPLIYPLFMPNPVISLNDVIPNRVLRGNSKPKVLAVRVRPRFIFVPYVRVPAFSPNDTFSLSALTKNCASFAVPSPCSLSSFGYGTTLGGFHRV